MISDGRRGYKSWGYLKKQMNDLLCDADFINSITAYLNTDVAASLHAGNYLLRVFAYLDRRVGKRTLIKIRDEAESLPEWVRQFYRIRCEAEGIRFSEQAPLDNRTAAEPAAAFSRRSDPAAPGVML